MCLTLGVTILDSTTEIHFMLYSGCIVDEQVWSDKYFMYIWITVFLLTAL